ncbi:MAG: deoxyribodipyrimidine photo-lyase [Blastochloris viridis]|uniref:Deoxyribodipyrimidine photo-lyase n=1 Tax=Blastochloris viridis TaxID=1079 RepID=A0A6N4RE04_BLAVI|nr:MAG: deoxyribodipyrimidine photo-lyase [Blastochloris viridis]
MTHSHTTIWWLRQDLRLTDNPALIWAAQRGKVLPVYINDRSRGRLAGGASKWWLQQSLEVLGTRIPLVIKSGTTEKILHDLIAETGADAVCWNRCYEPWAVHTDKDLKALLRESAGVEVESFNGALLLEPWEVKTGAGTEFKVFTPYWRAAVNLLNERGVTPCPAPKVTWLEGVKSDTLHLYPSRNEPDWAKGWDKLWTAGEEGAHKALQHFLKDALPHYANGRDLPAKAFTSKLSPHLHFGEISPRQIWAEARKHGGTNCEKFLSEVGWREFCHHLLYHYPTMIDSNWKRSFDAYPWRKLEGQAAKDFEAWTKGKTGYPLVDAGMRELWQTGWMHNRVRMVTASFLIKHLRIDWREGEKWFWDTLVDADAANNACGWQWVAGSGADASPYFRIFNSTAQAEKFDPQEAYIKKWVPEYGTAAYPKPIVNHEAARKAALEGYAKVRGD